MKEYYEVTYINSERSAIEKINTIRDLTNCSLDEAKNIVRKKNTQISVYQTKEQAESISAKFHFFGIKTSVQSVSEENAEFQIAGHDISGTAVRADDVYGAYKGQPLITKRGGYSFKKLVDIFIEDGWDLEKPVTKKSFMARFINQEKTAGMTVMNLEGNQSYILSVSRGAGINKPDFTLSGLTWGASAQDLIEIYGKPVMTKFDDRYSDEYLFTIQKGVQMKVHINKENHDEPGLSAVILCVE